MTDPDEPRDEAERAVDLICDAIDAQDAGDTQRVAAALDSIASMDADHLFASLSIFALAASEGWPKPKAGATVIPALFLGSPPQRIDIDSEPAAAFAMRLLAAKLNGDGALALDLWRAFSARLSEMDPGERAAEISQVLSLMVQLAAHGRRRARERAQHVRDHRRTAPRHGARYTGRRSR